MTAPEPAPRPRGNLDIARQAAAIIEIGRFTWNQESDLQAAIADAFTDAGWTAVREVHLPDGAGRIDIILTRPGLRIGVEVKVAGTPVAVARQLQRYAHTDLDVLILATTRHTHRAPEMPERVGGKPLLVAVIAGGAW